MKKKLEGKVAIVTASTQGIGLAIAEDLAQNGASVVISSRKEKNVQETVKSLTDKQLSVTGCVCHVGKKEDRDRLFKKTLDTYGRLDILVSNAAVNPTFGRLIDVSDSAWDKIFDVNLKAGFQLAKQAYPYLKETKGSMLFISSFAGYQPITGIGAYSISKTAIFGLVKVLAKESAGDGIRVNCIAPGIIRSNFSAALVGNIDEKYIKKRIPLNRLGTTPDISKAAVFLSSDEASYITGETLVINGGLNARL